MASASAIGRLGLCVFWVALTGCATNGRPAPPDLILHNGNIWTACPTAPSAQAVAIRGDRFIAVGSDSDVLSLSGPRSRVVDLGGRFTMPGFIDSHVHFAAAAKFLEFNIMTVTAQDEFVARVARVVADLEPGEWITGGYWGAYEQWNRNGDAPNRGRTFRPDMTAVEELTRLTPMFIRRFDDTVFAANTAALQAVGIDPAKRLPEGVRFELDARGTWRGLLSGDGVRKLFEAHIPRRDSRDRRMRQTRRALREMARFGVTGFHDMSDEVQLSIYRELWRRGTLTARVHFRYPLEQWRELAGRGIKVGAGHKWIRLGALKGHIDGIMGTSSARFFQPYANDPQNRGRWRKLMLDDKGRLAEGRFLKYLIDADAAGLQLSVHAIGDEANHVLLNYIEELLRTNGPRDRRFRVVHAQVMRDDDIARLGGLDVIAEVQPFHLSDDMRWMADRIGRDRCRGAYAFRSLAQAGARLSFGSDWPGTSASYYPINPMLAVYAAVTRKTTDGQPSGGWFPDQRMTVEQALQAYTINNAYASFEEDLKGSIEPGKLADLVVLSDDPFAVAPEDLLNVRVEQTWVAGKLVYSSVAD